MKQMENRLEINTAERIDIYNQRLLSIISNQMKTLGEKIDSVETNAEQYEDLCHAIEALYKAKRQMI